MKYLVKKDKKLRLMFSKMEMERLRMKMIIYNRNLSLGVRLHFITRLNMLRNSSKIRIKNRCLLTGRAQSVYRLFKLNRITLKEYYNKSKIYGLKKSSW